jgi:hypothetical protein
MEGFTIARWSKLRPARYPEVNHSEESVSERLAIEKSEFSGFGQGLFLTSVVKSISEPRNFERLC